MQKNIKSSFDRPFMTYDQQIHKLKNDYGLSIPNHQFAIKALSSLSYYDLVNGYKECFMPNGTYINGLTIEYLYTFLHFDRGIQNILFKYSVYVETIFKTKMAYTLAKNFGEDINLYLDPNNFISLIKSNRKNKFNATLTNIHNTYKKGSFIEHPTKHYINTKNHIPPWILLKNVCFNDAIDLYSFLKEKEKNEICNEMIINTNFNNLDAKKELLKSSITIIRKFRNKIAHNLKFVSYRSPQYIVIKDLKKVIPDELLTWPDYNKHKRGTNDPYSMILSLIMLLNDNYLASQMILEIKNHIILFIFAPDQSALFDDYCKITNLPNDMLNRFDNYIKKLSKS